MDAFSKLFLRFFAAMALFAFAGDLAADAISDAMGDHCNAQSSDASSGPEKSPCSHFACSACGGAMVMAEGPMRMSKSSELAGTLSPDTSARPVRRTASIDHPPQLG